MARQIFFSISSNLCDKVSMSWLIFWQAGLSPSLAADPVWQDDLLFTHDGISGPASLKASLFWRPGQEVALDFLPGSDLAALLDGPGQGKQTPRGLLRRLLPQRELLRQVGENARRELYISWDTSVANACRRYEVVLDNFRRGVYPARDTRVDELLLDTAESLDAINRLRAIPQQLRAAMDEDVRQWHDEIQENRLNARENRQKLQEKLSQLRQQIDRYL